MLCSLSSCQQWVKRVSHAYDKVNWTTLHVSERKECLYFLFDSKDKPRVRQTFILVYSTLSSWTLFENLIATLYPQFLEVVQYVLHHYPDSDIEDLEGEVNLLLILPTPLALKVVRFNCCRALTLQHVPSLMRKGIQPQKVTHYNLCIMVRTFRIECIEW